MNENDIKPGLMVYVTDLDTTDGMIINNKHLVIREKGKQGVVKGWVPGHGGDVWFVQQDNGIAAYSFTELEPAFQPAAGWINNIAIADPRRVIRLIILINLCAWAFMMICNFIAWFLIGQALSQAGFPLGPVWEKLL